MPRATEPKPRVGGAMAPEATESITRTKMLQGNRMLEAMRQAGATERGKMQAATQLQTTQMGVEGQKEVAAMQEAEADRRAAEKIRGDEEDRKFNLSLQRVTEKGAADRKQMQIDHENAIRSGNLGLLSEMQAKDQAQEIFNKMVDNKNAKMSTRIALELGNRSIESEQDLASFEIKYQQTSSEFKRNRGSFENVRDEVSGRVGTTEFGDAPLQFGLPTIPDLPLGVQLFNEEVIREQLPQLSAKLLTSAGQSKIEKMFGSGELKGFDYVKGGAVIDGLIIGFSDKIKEITGVDPLKEPKQIEKWWRLGPLGRGKTKEKFITEAGKRVQWLELEMNRLQNMRKVWRNVADSDEPMRDIKNLTVRKMLAMPKGIWLDVSPAKNFAELQELTNNNIEAQRTLVNDPSYFDYTNFFLPEEIETQKNSNVKEMMIEFMGIYGQED